MTSHPSINSNAIESFKLGNWVVEPQASSLLRDNEKTTVEPQVMDLLVLLAREPGKVVSRSDIELALWPHVVVGEDSLARTVSKLRRALGDKASSPTFIETIPKRGYRLIAEVSRPRVSVQNGLKVALSLVLIAMFSLAGLFYYQAPPLNPSLLNPLLENENSKLTQRADDLYMQFTRADNEAAISLYQRVIEDDPNYALAHAGLANSLVQRVIRWQHKPGGAGLKAPTLTKALDSGMTETADGQALLSRAASLAERAFRLAPRDPAVIKALAFSYSAQGDLGRAKRLYQHAIEIDKNAWAPMINLGEIHLIQGKLELSNKVFEKAYAAMDRVYAQEPQKVGPWQAALGINIGDGYEALGSKGDAERWYRRVLKLTPLEPLATTKLAAVLRDTGRAAEAESLCSALVERVGLYKGCTNK